MIPKALMCVGLLLAYMANSAPHNDEHLNFKLKDKPVQHSVANREKGSMIYCHLENLRDKPMRAEVSVQFPDAIVFDRDGTTTMERVCAKYTIMLGEHETSTITVRDGDNRPPRPFTMITVTPID